MLYVTLCDQHLSGALCSASSKARMLHNQQHISAQQQCARATFAILLHIVCRHGSGLRAYVQP